MNKKAELEKIKEISWLPICISKARISSSDVSIYGASVPKLMTTQYRSVAYYKPVSKIIGLPEEKHEQ